MKLRLISAAAAADVSIENVTSAEVYFGRAETILAERKRIKLATIATDACQPSCGLLKL